MICQWLFWKRKGTSKTGHKNKCDHSRSESVSASQDRKTPQKSNIIYERFLVGDYFRGNWMYVHNVFVWEKRFSKEPFKITGKRTEVLIVLCDFRKYRNADMILVEVI